MMRCNYRPFGVFEWVRVLLYGGAW